jgi:hypothetical protein
VNATAIVLIALAFNYGQSAIAQAADVSAAAKSGSSSSCERPATAPAWLPCGPDRILSEADLRKYVVRSEWTTHTQIKGADSGKLYFLNLMADGTMEGGLVGGQNIGKSWSQQGEKICRTYTRFYNGPRCATFELKSGVLYLVDVDNSRNPITSIEFVKN